MQNLKGKNQIGKQRQIAETLKSSIASHKGIAGIVYIGGLTRGFADKHSDIDIIALLAKKDENLRKTLRKLGSDTQERTGVDIDLEIHFLEDFKTWKWTEMNKWDFSHAEIAFDPDGEIHRLFREKLKLPRTYWLKRIVIFGEYLKWYCCPPKEGVGTMVEAWVDRGDLVSAHYCLNYSLDILIRVTFALNKEFLPPPKWGIHYSYRLKWLPAGYVRLLKEAVAIRSFSKRDFDRRLKAIRKMWNEILPKIEEETGLTPDTISKCYVEKVLRQN